MRWSNFVEISETSSIHSYSRVLSNWLLARQRMSASATPTVLHRISSRRVIIEVPSPPSSKRGARRVRYLIAISGGAVILLLIGIILLDNRIVSSNGHDRAHKPLVSSTEESAVLDCRSLSMSTWLDVASLSEFNLGDWRILTTSTTKTLGSVLFAGFKAACGQKVEYGTLTAQQMPNGFRILRMTPT